MDGRVILRKLAAIDFAKGVTRGAAKSSMNDFAKICGRISESSLRKVVGGTTPKRRWEPARKGLHQARGGPASG